MYGNPPPFGHLTEDCGGLGVFLRKCGILYLGDCHGEPSVSFADSSPVYGFCNPKQVLDRISPEDCGAFALTMTAKMKTALIGIYPRGRLLRGLLCGLFEGGEGVLVKLALL